MFFFKLAVHLIALAPTLSCPLKKYIEPCVCSHKEITCENRGLPLEQTVAHLKGSAFSPVKKFVVKGMKLGTLNLQVLDGIPFYMLELSNCQLQALTDSGIINLPHLKTIKVELSIDENRSDFDLDLHKILKLRRLLLTENVIKRVKSRWFSKDLGHLLYLSLARNQLEEIEDGAFKSLLNLQIINLKKNLLRVIKRSMFPSSVKSLSALYLSYNQLQTIPEDFFSEMSSLKHLDLRHNKIQQLPERTWRAVWLRVTFLHLIDNPLDCSSYIEWISKYRNPATVTGRCVSPYDRKHMRLITLILILRNEYPLPPHWHS